MNSFVVCKLFKCHKCAFCPWCQFNMLQHFSYNISRWFSLCCVSKCFLFRINDLKTYFIHIFKSLYDTQCIFVNIQWHLASCKCFLENHCVVCECTHAHTHSTSSSLFVNGPCFLCPHRKSNWIADRMKKLIKPRGGGREGRALFTAAGSVENLADSTEFTSDTQAPQPGETTHAHTAPHNTLPSFYDTHKHQTTSFHKDMLTCSPHQARLQACIQIISWLPSVVGIDATLCSLDLSLWNAKT